MNISEALSSRGIEFNMIGPEPKNEAEYLERVTAHVGTLPDWATISAEAEALNYHTVSKITVINRLDAENKFEAALAALKTDDKLYEKWSAVSEIRSNDANAIALFTAIGCDPNEILATEE